MALVVSSMVVLSLHLELGRDMILDYVSVANLDEVNLLDKIVSGVIFPKFTCLVLV